MAGDEPVDHIWASHESREPAGKGRKRLIVHRVGEGGGEAGYGWGLGSMHQDWEWRDLLRGICADVADATIVVR
jgi:hypothetical protein